MAAYRLPDGRMAFKTKDGKRVFDKQGAELSHDTIDPASIPDTDTKPRWKTFKAARETEQRQLFQKKVDDARDAAGKPGITTKEFNDLDADLQRDMPDAVKQRFSAMFRLRNLPDPRSRDRRRQLACQLQVWISAG